MRDKYLVVGDGVFGPLMALSLRLNNIHCDLLMTKSISQQDQGVIVLTPSSTQILGDVFNIAVPHGSVVTRFLSFDHVGNELSDMNLNKYRLDGVSPTFYVCQRHRIQESLLSLCKSGSLACKILPESAVLDYAKIRTNEDDTVNAELLNTPFINSRYKKIICTNRDQSSALFMQENHQASSESQLVTLMPTCRWLELTIPALSEAKGDGFAPGGNELVELITNASSKLIVKPTLIGTKLFYNVLFSMKRGMKGPQAHLYEPRKYWNDFVMHWSAGKPEYINHTLFQPLMSEIQRKCDGGKMLVYKTPSFVRKEWATHQGTVLHIGPSAYSTYADAVDVLDNCGFADCYLLAQRLAKEENSAVQWLQTTRRGEVMAALEFHKDLNDFTFRERGQFAYMCNRFQMKILGKFKKKWGSILKPMISLL
ncbi:2-polyprenyl-6-methoxyphenol hydroxylase-like oxidoreductase [Perkinsela sp. CCAP 1560/4]|nr:2-polyprenyl-6-methoxyphenol hydroxylase-like oxidoreductase [Perkinsela sp. CCAP 1560/4]|eukprot:KNH07630.1 2-polyprenyl-6-methoxyphenol hydroxylase-like oxidoreductase [Perkinsela sp. CCAP 1560/4]